MAYDMNKEWWTWWHNEWINVMWSFGENDVKWYIESIEHILPEQACLRKRKICKPNPAQTLCHTAWGVHVYDTNPRETDLVYVVS